jgi:hypothetical protein
MKGCGVRTSEYCPREVLIGNTKYRIAEDHGIQYLSYFTSDNGEWVQFLSREQTALLSDLLNNPWKEF